MAVEQGEQSSDSIKAQLQSGDSKVSPLDKTGPRLRQKVMSVCQDQDQ